MDKRWCPLNDIHRSQAERKERLGEAFAFWRHLDDDGAMLSHERDLPPEPLLDERRPDPGSNLGAMVAALVSIGMLVFIFLSQQGKVEAHQKPGAGAVQTPSSSDPFIIELKVVLKLNHVLSGTSPDPNLTKMMQENVDQSAHTERQRLWAAMSSAEITGPAEAYTRLTTLRDELAVDLAKELAKPTPPAPVTPSDANAPAEPPPPPPGQEIREVLADIEPLMQAYSSKATDLPDATRQELIARNGWIGKVAMTTGQAVDSAERKELLGGGAQLLALFVIAGVLILVGGILGLVLFIVGIVKVSGGNIERRLIRPAPGGSVYLETLAIFFLAFVGVKLVVGAIAVASKLSDEEAQNLALGTQWILVLVPFWPLLRGVSFRQLRQDIGWTTGQGVFKEIGAGIVGYLAGIPIFLFFVVISLVLTIVRAKVRASGGEVLDPGPPENPIFDLASSKGMGLVLLFTLATIWAPIVEEAVFRGCLYRFLRTWLWIPVGALVSAMVFGLVHGYDWVMLGPVIGLGFNFALLREWRGSLIAPMTAHCMHNAMSLVFVISILRLMGD